MKCETCSHYDGEYCISGIITDRDVKVANIGKMMREVEEKYGCILHWGDDCDAYEEYEEEE